MPKTIEKPWLISDEQLASSREQFAGDWIFDPSSGIFARPWCAGYWLFGVEYDAKLGWLALEFDEQLFDSTDEEQEPLLEAAALAWKTGTNMEGVKLATDDGAEIGTLFHLDRAFAERAFANGVAKWGRDWYESHDDAAQIDELVQWTLLGEHRYG